jgi:thiosulfate reductase cytochrome b subunit
MNTMAETGRKKGPLIYRHRLVTRLTHWSWAICLLFLLMSGLQIFNAHPTLYWGNQSGFEFDNAVLKLRGVYDAQDVLHGQTTVFGTTFDTTGLLGASVYDGELIRRGFPAYVTAPSWQDLATGRIIHFFFAWIFVGVLFVWYFASLINGHARREVLPDISDLKSIPISIVEHAKLKFHHDGRYNGLQKLAYASVLFVLFPLIIFTGLAMSPGMDSAFPFLTEVFGGRQSARTVHFISMFLLVLFFIVHMVMVVAAGPINELRSIVTGWYRKDPETHISGEAQ